MSKLKLFLLTLTAVALCQVATFDFVALDDARHLLDNPNSRSFSLETVKAHWEKPYLKLYIPLTYSVWSLLSEIAPKREDGTPHPAVFHLANLALHLLNVSLVWSLFSLFGASETSVFLVSALFALHPMQAESIAWVSGMKDLLSASFLLAALLVLLKRPASSAVLASVTLLYFLSLVAKPSAVVFPAIAFLLVPNERRRALVPWFGAWIVLALPLIWITEKSQYFGFPSPTLAERLVIAADAVGFYVEKILWPISLASDYARAPYRLMENPISVSLVIGVLALVAAGIAAFRKIFWPLIPLIFLLPTLGLIAFVYQTTSTVADRYVYLALFGMGLGFIQVTRISARVAIAIALVLAIGMSRQASYWKDTPTLLRHTAVVTPESWMTWHNLGVWYEHRGELAESERCYLESSKFRPPFVTSAAEAR